MSQFHTPYSSWMVCLCSDDHSGCRVDQVHLLNVCNTNGIIMYTEFCKIQLQMVTWMIWEKYFYDWYINGRKYCVLGSQSGDNVGSSTEYKFSVPFMCFVGVFLLKNSGFQIIVTVTGVKIIQYFHFCYFSDKMIYFTKKA